MSSSQQTDNHSALTNNGSTAEDDMKATPTRTNQLISALTSVQSRIYQTTNTHSVHRPIRLVAVSKLKPLDDVLALASPLPSSSSSSSSSPTPTHHIPHTHFGENYVQELLEKSKLVPQELRGKIKWHFIGGLQSNKAQTLARDVQGLWAVESVDSLKKAKLLDKGRGERRQQQQQYRSDEGDKGSTEKQAKDRDEEQAESEPDEGPLRVFVQVNTSSESSKSGLEPHSADLLTLCRTIRSEDECPNLSLQGLMTIGALARSQASGSSNSNPTSTSTSSSNEPPPRTQPEEGEEEEGREAQNQDFTTLKQTRDWIVQELDLQKDQNDTNPLELSMGMSEDFEVAIQMGSDEVRVGSTIFGARPAKKGAAG